MLTLYHSERKKSRLAAECVYKYTSCYSLQSACNDNAIVEGFLTLTPEDISAVLTYFEFGDDYMYDKEKMEDNLSKKCQSNLGGKSFI